jgi:hypothetical protein
MNTLFIYPPYLNYKIKFITTKYKFDKKTKEVIIKQGTIINRNNSYWNNHYLLIDKKYKNKTKLTKGSFLYRCSTNKDPLNIEQLNNIKNDVIYFGLDFVIAIWIALEIYEKTSGEIKSYYLHIYQLTKDINYKYLYSEGADGVPMELDPKSCIKKPCIHPQEILHGNNSPYKSNELGTEISFPKTLLNKTITTIKPIKTFEIDIDKLKKNKDKYIYQWDPIKALKLS